MTGKVLLIEDNDDTAHFIKNYLIRMGYIEANLVRCSTISEVYALADHTIEVVITDLTLPDSKHLETVNHVSRIFPNSPIVILTGTAPEEFAKHAFDKGVEDYLLKKHLDFQTLKRSVTNAIQRNRIHNDYKRLFEENPAPMYIFDEHTHEFLAVNTAALDQYGYTEEEFLAMNVEEIRPQEDLPDFLKARATSTSAFYNAGRWRHKNKNGDIFYVNIYSHSSTFEERPVKIVIAININETVQAELKVKEKNIEIQEIFESITDGFFSVDKNWDITYINKTGELLLNISSHESAGRNLWDIFPEAKNSIFYEAYHHAVNNDVAVHFEEYFAPLKKWFSVNAYPSSGRLSVYFIDITEQKILHDKIARNKNNLKAIINNTDDVIWSVDKDFNIITANKSFWKRLKQITGKNPSDVSQEDFTSPAFYEWKQFFGRGLEGNTFKTVWKEVVDGNDRFEEISFNPIYDDAGTITGVSCFSRDITAQQLYQQMIESQNKKLREIAWMQSHEARRPVANILGLVELFNTENLNDPFNVEVIKYIKQSAVQMDEIIRRIAENADTIQMAGHKNEEPGGEKSG